MATESAIVEVFVCLLVSIHALAFTLRIVTAAIGLLRSQVAELRGEIKKLIAEFKKFIE